MTPFNIKMNILILARKLLSNQSIWCKDSSARKNGVQCLPWDSEADAWSTYGMLESILIDRGQRIHVEPIIDEIRKDSELSITDENLSYPEVLARLDKTIDRLKLELETYQELSEYRYNLALNRGE